MFLRLVVCTLQSSNSCNDFFPHTKYTIIVYWYLGSSEDGHFTVFSSLGPNVKQEMEIEAMKNILVHMAQEQASSRLEANPDEVSHLYEQSYIYSGKI